MMQVSLTGVRISFVHRPSQFSWSLSCQKWSRPKVVPRTTFGNQNCMVPGDHFWLPKLVPGDHFWQPKVVPPCQKWSHPRPILAAKSGPPRPILAAKSGPPRPFLAAKSGFLKHILDASLPNNSASVTSLRF